jgi:hypothetical protein
VDVQLPSIFTLMGTVIVFDSVYLASACFLILLSVTSFEAATSEGNARDILRRKQVEHYWDLMKSYDPAAE